MEEKLMEFAMSMAVKFPVLGTVLAALGALVVIGLAFVKITKSIKDDEFVLNLMKHPYYGKIVRVIVAFSPIQPKEKK